MTPATALDLAPERVDEKVAWVQAAMKEAGRPADAVEMEVGIFMSRITDTASEAREATDSIAAMFGADPDMVRSSPATLFGSVEQCIEMLLERRERWGFSCVHLGSEIDQVAPIVQRLAGT
jgi:alkanesulfonate monooxygenase SsuD/methylene tetrahydromethanopterin reductase-like flavin-dependent oxidoreductase (luciferase family)